MTEFFRFPHTPHLAWLGANEPRDDKVLSSEEASALLSADVVVEEKLDGANLGLSLSPEGHLVAQNRGQYLMAPYAGQFTRLAPWLAQHAERVAAGITQDLMLFGEWCAARHSLSYDSLPDWFLLFDVYDRNRHQFWSCSRRDTLAKQLGMSPVPRVAQGRFALPQLETLLSVAPSRYGKGFMEGLIVRRESAIWCQARAKLVRADFTQSIDMHWRKRVIEWNRVQPIPTEASG